MACHCAPRRPYFVLLVWTHANMSKGAIHFSSTSVTIIRKKKCIQSVCRCQFQSHSCSKSIFLRLALWWFNRILQSSRPIFEAKFMQKNQLAIMWRAVSIWHWHMSMLAVSLVYGAREHKCQKFAQHKPLIKLVNAFSCRSVSWNNEKFLIAKFAFKLISSIN